MCDLNKQLQKVIDGLSACMLKNDCSHCDECSYDDADVFACRVKLRDDAIKLLKEYDSALRGMVYQYCTVDKKFFEGENRVIRNPDQEVFFHRFMSAGEEAFRVLGIKNGEEVTDEFIWS